MAEQNKTERATPRRRQKAREQGQVARSRDLVAGVGTMAAVLLLSWQLRAFAGQWRAVLSRELQDAALQPDQLLPAWRDHLGVFRGVVLAAGLSWLAATSSGLAQGGLVLAPTALAPNFNRLSPASKLGQLFSLSALSRLLKSLLPAAVIVSIGVAVVARDWTTLPGFLHASAGRLMEFVASEVFEVAWKASLALLLWSAADYFLERQHHENELKMSRQELRDESKETDGNPAVKQRIRRLQRQARRRRMLKDVERAAVVVTNPTAFAIALEYRVDMDAPVVVAKGRNLLAAQIKEIARWHGIPLVENPPLAHALYRAVEVGQAIPAQLYTVVAEILAAIWRAQSRAGQASTKSSTTAPSTMAAAPGRV